MTCQRCYFWRPLQPDSKQEIGVCRRMPPVAHPQQPGDSFEENFAHWPLTPHDAWCGEYKNRGI